MSKRYRSDDTPSSKRQKLPKGYHMMPDGTVMRDSDHDLAEDLASTADMLAARPDLWRSDPLPRAEPLVSDPTTVPRKGLSRLGRAEAAARPRRTAAQAPDAPRRRGENRAASVFNRAPGWAPALSPCGCARAWVPFDSQNDWGVDQLSDRASVITLV